MTPFDIIDTCDKAYCTAWSQRPYLLRLIAVPLAVKIVFFMLVMILGFENHLLRQTLVMLPAYFLEGWMAAHIVRLAFYNEKALMLSPDKTIIDMKAAMIKGRAVMAAILIYVLIKMAQNAAVMPLVNFQNNYEVLSANLPEASPVESLNIFALIAAGGILAMMIWVFKFLFAFIPYAADVPFKLYAAKLPGFSSSFRMIAVWLVCYVPFLLLSAVVVTILRALLGSVSENLFVFLLYITHFALDMAAMCVVFLALSFAAKNAMFIPSK